MYSVGATDAKLVSDCQILGYSRRPHKHKLMLRELFRQEGITRQISTSCIILVIESNSCLWTSRETRFDVRRVFQALTGQAMVVHQGHVRSKTGPTHS